MTPEDFQTIERTLASTHKDMADLLGVSHVSVKRYATGAQAIPSHVAKLAVALCLIKEDDLQNKFAALLAKYHSDT